MNRDELLENLAMEVGEWPECMQDLGEWLMQNIAPSDDIAAIKRCAIRTADGPIHEGDWLAERERLINKPSWGDVLGSAPWARFITQVADGWWHAYDDEPYAFGDTYLIGTHGGKSQGICKGVIPAGHRWQDTLERRPALTTSLGASEQPYCPMLDSEMSSADAINPDHYKIGGIETIDYMKAKATPDEFRRHLRLTAIKYLSRAGHKDELLREYRKAAWYLGRLIVELESAHE